MQSLPSDPPTSKYVYSSQLSRSFLLGDVLLILLCCKNAKKPVISFRAPAVSVVARFFLISSHQNKAKQRRPISSNCINILMNRRDKKSAQLKTLLMITAALSNEVIRVLSLVTFLKNVLMRRHFVNKHTGPLFCFSY